MAELGANKWRFFCKQKIKHFSEEAVMKLRKDPQMSFGIKELRVLQGAGSQVEDARAEPSVALNIKKDVVFDSNCAHEVEPFEGERYSLIFFTLKKYERASSSVKRRMVKMGVDWPTAKVLKRLSANVAGLPRSSKKDA